MANEHHSITTYLSDMLALERHVRVPFETQAKDDDFSKYGDAHSIVSTLLDRSERHIAALQSTLERHGGHEGSPVKSTVSAVEGVIAGAIDMVRKTKVSKALRDDYTALALCAAGYTMLQTTALALDAADVAQLAQRHLEDWAEAVMTIGESLPSIVVAELRDIGIDAEPSVVEPARAAAHQAWRAGAAAAHAAA